jgi:hypothetical protein
MGLSTKISWQARSYYPEMCGWRMKEGDAGKKRKEKSGARIDWNAGVMVGWGSSRLTYSISNGVLN